MFLLIWTFNNNLLKVIRLNYSKYYNQNYKNYKKNLQEGKQSKEDTSSIQEKDHKKILIVFIQAQQCLDNSHIMSNNKVIIILEAEIIA